MKASAEMIRGSPPSMKGSPSNIFVKVYIASFPMRIELSKTRWNIMKIASTNPLALCRKSILAGILLLCFVLSFPVKSSVTLSLLSILILV